MAINPSFPLSNTLAITRKEISPAINGSRGVTPSVCIPPVKASINLGELLCTTRIEIATKVKTDNPAASRASTNCRVRFLVNNEIPTNTGTKIIEVAPIVFKIKRTKLGKTLVAVVKSASNPAVV